MFRKRLLVVFAISLIVFLTITLFLVYNQSPELPAVESKGESYLAFQNGGDESKAYLVSSKLYYGVYDESFSWPYSVNKGDSCVIINGTIRNDYDKDYFFTITADVYNVEGETVGLIVTPNTPHVGFSVAQIDKGSTGFFELRLKYDVKDVSNYDLFLAFTPSDDPPP